MHDVNAMGSMAALPAPQMFVTVSPSHDGIGLTGNLTRYPSEFPFMMPAKCRPAQKHS
jgi:hypothetical protein